MPAASRNAGGFGGLAADDTAHAPTSAALSPTT